METSTSSEKSMNKNDIQDISERINQYNQGNKNNNEDSEILVNSKGYYLSSEFQNIFFNRRKTFSGEPSELQKEYFIWHKELGNKIYNKSNKKFNSIYDFVKINNFLIAHPNLTVKDEKELLVFKNEINSKYNRLLVLNSCIGGLFFIMFLRRQRNSLKNFVLTNKIRITFSVMSSLVLFDILFRTNIKTKFLIENLEKKGLVIKYFNNYL